MQEVKPNKLQTYTFRTPEVFKRAEISQLRGKLKAHKRAEAMAERYAKMQRAYERDYQEKLAEKLNNWIA